MSTRLTRATVLAVCAVAMAACTEQGSPIPSGNTGTSTPETTGETTAPSEDRHGAPPVEKPLDASRQLADPCTSLASDQLRALDMLKTARPGDKSEFDSLGPYCSWRDSSDTVDFTVGYLVPNENGLADLYRGQEQGEWAYWEPTTVRSYPAVWQNGVDLRDSGHCTISVGITDELTFSVFSRRAEPAEACDKVKEIAGAVVETLKNGG